MDKPIPEGVRVELRRDPDGRLQLFRQGWNMLFARFADGVTEAERQCFAEALAAAQHPTPRPQGEVELLPLPSIQRWKATGDYAFPAEESDDGSLVDYDEHVSAMKAYALANVAHATAAKDAEIEALRAEVEEARDGWRMANGTAELAMKHRDAAEARAERLAEALREIEGIATGSRTVNSLPHIQKIAARALEIAQ